MNPYKSLPSKAFWRPAVADRSMFEVAELWQPKYHISPSDPVATFGSCFAQHIGRELKERGYHWMITENGPYGMGAKDAQELNYGVFSCRTGNIYTTSLLKQWTSWALGESMPPDEYWESSGKIFDPFRPAVEPGGFESIDEMRRSRLETINAFKRCILKSKCFVFTLGLTESWRNSNSDYEYPMCPGTVAGEFDEKHHIFVNQTFWDVKQNLAASIQMMRKVNPSLKILLTVSPVPLTATKSGKHVLVATMHSKSVLRAVAGMLSDGSHFIDYFPSYEIINSPAFRGAFFGPNQRNVTDFGVKFVMSHFFDSLKSSPSDQRSASKSLQPSHQEVCEEELLSAFESRV